MLYFLEGKRTYLVLGAALVLGVIDSWNGYCAGPGAAEFCFNIEVPGFVFSGLAALGIYTRKLAG